MFQFGWPAFGSQWGIAGTSTPPPVTTAAAMSSPDAWPSTGSTVTITKGTSGGVPVGGVLTLGGSPVTGTDNGATITYVVPVLAADQTLLWTPASGAAASMAVYRPWTTDADTYFDQTDTLTGAGPSLNTRGTAALSFSSVAFTGGAAPASEVDGLRLNGNILRNTNALGTFSRMTIVLDVTRIADPISGAGELVAINSSGTAPVRFWLRYTSGGFQALGPNGVAINYANIGEYGDRQVIAAELDLTSGTMTSVAADGITQTVAVSQPPISITRIEIGKACVAKIHRCAIILE